MEMCKYKLNTGSNGNLMTSKMFKTLFPHITIADLNKSIETYIIL